MSINTLQSSFKYEKIRYKNQGFGILISILIAIIYIYYTPILITAFYPHQIENEGYFYFSVSYLLHEFTIITSMSIVFLVYTLNSPFFESYKVTTQPWPWNESQEKWSFLKKKALKNYLFNHLVTLPLSQIFFIAFNFSPVSVSFEDIPTHSQIIKDLLFYIFSDDLIFYWVHRILHWELFYPYVHKQHHEFYNVTALLAEYAHPIEFLLGNVLATSSGSLILNKKTHLVTLMMWIIIRTIEAVDVHCGYEFSFSPYHLLPFSSSGEFHLYHHLRWKGNYASLTTIWDRVFFSISPKFDKFIDQRNNGQYLKDN